MSIAHFQEISSGGQYSGPYNFVTGHVMFRNIQLTVLRKNLEIFTELQELDRSLTQSLC